MMEMISGEHHHGQRLILIIGVITGDGESEDVFDHSQGREVAGHVGELEMLCPV